MSTTNIKAPLIFQKGSKVWSNFVDFCHFPMFLEFAWKNKLRYVRIYFDTPTFDRITKDRAAKFVDYVSVFGGTMGLLTGFSIISGVEILYYVFKYIISFAQIKK